MGTNKKSHWESIYQTKQPHEVSWTQEIPSLSLRLIEALNLQKDAEIIDVGGGDSKLVDFLLDYGYTNISVLDISEFAINRAKSRLGERAKNVTWIVSDVLEFQPLTTYQLWHDRAAFHFQTEASQIESYLKFVEKSTDGYLVIGTFSDEGPKRCSGLDIQQYNEEQLISTFSKGPFTNLLCQREDHTTPSGSVQNFLFGVFKKD